VDDEGVAFLRWALPELGLRWEGFKRPRAQVLKRIARRHRALGIGDLAGYRAHLEANEAEWDVLEALCRVTITRFHRDRAVFETLRTTVLPALATSSPIRCWSAGCASGEEPYTLALIDRFDSPGVPLDILATDADEVLLARAARARYPRATLRELPRAWVEAAFLTEDGERVLREEITRRVRFVRHDLRHDPAPGPFELVLCRNLAFTYFGPAGQRAAFDLFASALVPGGALVIGVHEVFPGDRRFTSWARAIYRRA
jgi:chemotaxis protein methyltransferase CheR